MAKLPRIFANRFGDAAGAAQIAQFGSLLAGAPATTVDPAVAQSLSNWNTGWLGAAIGGNAPAIEDMNATSFVLSFLICYLMQAGVPEWETGTTYYTGSLCMVGGTIYVSLIDANLANAVTDVSKWARYGGKLLQKTANFTLTGGEDFVEFDTTTGDCTANLPSAGGFQGKKLTITKTSSDANVVSVTNAAQILQLVAQYDSVTVFSNGGIWYAV